jgi:hypothetical protein
VHTNEPAAVKLALISDDSMPTRGFDTTLFLQPPPEHLLCVACDLVVCTAVSLCHDGHICCHSCSAAVSSCPSCAQRVDGVHKIRHVDSTVMELLVKCGADSCGWYGPLKARHDHILECPAKLKQENADLKLRLAEEEHARKAEDLEVTKRVLGNFAAALTCGRAGGHELADLLSASLGADDDLAVVGHSLSAAASLLLAAGRAAPLSDAAPPLPPASQMCGVELNVDIMQELFSAFIALPSPSKMALASTCRLWRKALWHPACWQRVETPRKLGFSHANQGQWLGFVQKSEQLLLRTRTIHIAVGSSVSFVESSLQRLLDAAAHCVELEVSSSVQRAGDTIFDSMRYHPQIGGIVRKRIEVLRLQNLRLSNHQSNANVWRRQRPAPAGGYEWQTLWEKLRVLELLNVPPLVEYDNLMGVEIRRSDVDAAIKIINSVPTLEELILRNPSAADTGGPCRLAINVAGVRNGDPPWDDSAYQLYKAHLPPSPTQPKGRVWR